MMQVSFAQGPPKLVAAGPVEQATDSGFQLFNAALEKFLGQMSDVDLQRRFSILANYINSYFDVADALGKAAAAVQTLQTGKPRATLVSVAAALKKNGSDSGDDNDSSCSSDEPGTADLKASAKNVMVWNDMSAVRENTPEILSSVIGILRSWSIICESHIAGTSFPSPLEMRPKGGSTGSESPGTTTPSLHAPSPLGGGRIKPSVVARDVACGLTSMIFEKSSHHASVDEAFDEWKKVISPVFGVPASDRAAAVHGDSQPELTQLQDDPMEVVRRTLEGKEAAVFALTEAKERAISYELRSKFTSRALQRSLAIEEGKRIALQRLVLKEVFGSWRFRVLVDKSLRGQQDDREVALVRLTASNEEKTKQNKRLQDRLQELTKGFERESHETRKQLEVEKENGITLSKKIRELLDNNERQSIKIDEAHARILFLTSENERFQEKLRVYFHASRGDQQAMEEVKRIAARGGGVGGASGPPGAAASSGDGDNKDVGHVQKNGPMNFVSAPPAVKKASQDEEDHAAAAVDGLLELVGQIAEALAPVPAAAFTGGDDDDMNLADFQALLMYVVDQMRYKGSLTPHTPSSDELRATSAAGRRSARSMPDLPKHMNKSPIPGATPQPRLSVAPHAAQQGGPPQICIMPAGSQVPVWVQMLASTMLTNAPNCLDMSVLLVQQQAAAFRSRQRYSSGGGGTTGGSSTSFSTSSPRGSVPSSVFPAGVAAGGAPSLIRNLQGKLSADSVLDVAALISGELTVLQDLEDVCAPRAEHKLVAKARQRVMAAASRAKAMEAVRAQFISDIILEDRRSTRLERIPSSSAARH